MAASVSCFSRISLPVALSPPSLRSFLASSPRRSLPSLRPSPLRDPGLRSGTGPRLDARLFAADANASADPVVESVSVQAAHELLKSGYRYLDVRTPEEFINGHPVEAVNIPYMLRSFTVMKKNPDFLVQISSTFKKDDQIVVGCQSGKRSFMAATDLIAAGFTAIIDATGGFYAWTEAGLPTE